MHIPKLLSFYESESPGVKTSLTRMLRHGYLAGRGKLLILAVDQGFEHGPFKSFSVNPEAFHPHYHFRVAVEGGFSAYAAPLGWLEAGADTFVGEVPLILKMNHSYGLHPKTQDPNQAVVGSVDEALRLGCVGIGFTLYPGSENCLSMFEDFREIAKEARAKGLCVVAWCYPRGSALSKEDERSLDVIAYGAHLCALLGAHIIKVKIPTTGGGAIDMVSRIRHIMQCTFDGRRIVLFSGGEIQDEEDLMKEVRSVAAGGGHGSIIGRNIFQRPFQESMDLIGRMMNAYRS